MIGFPSGVSCIDMNDPTAERVHDGRKEGEEAFPIQRSSVGGVFFHSGVSIAHDDL